MSTATRWYAVPLFLIVLCVCTHAQTPTGQVSGTVFDESGALIPNAGITVVNTETGLTRQLKSDTVGVYSTAALPPGKYEVRAKVEGFHNLVRQATIEAGSTTASRNCGVANQ